MTDLANFQIEAVIWLSVRPEHQHLIVGWNSNGEGYVTSYLILNKYIPDVGDTHDGLILFDSTGVPIWKFNADENGKSELLGQRGYYLPVKYGYSFTNEDVTKTISLVYSKKDYSYLTLPNNIDYKGNTLNFSECENVIYSNQVLRSENERFSLVLQEN